MAQGHAIAPHELIGLAAWVFIEEHNIDINQTDWSEEDESHYFVYSISSISQVTTGPDTSATQVTVTDYLGNTETIFIDAAEWKYWVGNDPSVALPPMETVVEIINGNTEIINCPVCEGDRDEQCPVCGGKGKVGKEELDQMIEDARNQKEEELDEQPLINEGQAMDFFCGVVETRVVLREAADGDVFCPKCGIYASDTSFKDNHMK